jgi:pilus assembly protein CpaE
MSACQVSSTIFLVVSQELPSLRNAQRYVTALSHLGVHQDQIKVVVNHYNKKPSPHLATLEQISQTLNQPVFFGIPSSPIMLASLNKGRPMVSDREAAPELDKSFRAFVDKATGAKPAAMAKAATAK